MTEQDKQWFKKIIESNMNAEKCPTALHALGQPSTSALWLLVKFAQDANVLDTIMNELESTS